MEASYEAKIKKFIFMSSSVVYQYTAEKPNNEDEFIFGDLDEENITSHFLLVNFFIYFFFIF